MKKFKSAIAITISLLVIFCNFASTFASDTDYSSANIDTVTTNDGKEPDRSEVTEYKYRRIDGILYKRLWSVTYNHWIDPYWSPA